MFSGSRSTEQEERLAFSPVDLHFYYWESADSFFKNLLKEKYKTWK